MKRAETGILLFANHADINSILQQDFFTDGIQFGEKACALDQEEKLSRRNWRIILKRMKGKKHEF